MSKGIYIGGTRVGTAVSGNSGCGIVIVLFLLLFVFANFLDKILPIALPVLVIWGGWAYRQHRHNIKEQEKAARDEEQRRISIIEEHQRQEQIRSAEREQDRQELEQLRKIPTSLSWKIQGYRIGRQIKTIAVDGYREKDAAELEFLRQVKAAGGNAVVNIRPPYRRGGYFSMQGDAVELLPVDRSRPSKP